MTDDARRTSLGVGGALAEDPHPALVETAFADELEAQLELTYAESLADLAHILVAVEQGVIPRDPGRRLVRLLLELHDHPDRLEASPNQGDLYTNREAWIRAHDPQAADWLGVGRARREATTVALRLAARSQLADLASELLDLAAALVTRAQDEADLPFPDFTYLRVTQAGTWGHYLLGAAQPVLRDVSRIRDLWPRINEGPVVLGAGLGSRLPLDRAQVANALGFSRPVAHTRDATWQADLMLETIGVATISTVNQARLAEDLLVYSSQAFGLVELPDRLSRASRVLPQKRNPFGLAWIRALANRAIGAQTAATAAQRSATGMPDSRLEATRALLSTLRAATVGARLLRTVVQELRVDGEAVASRLGEGAALAPDLAEALVERGVPWATAHALVARLFRELRAERRAVEDPSATDAVERLLTAEGGLAPPGITASMIAETAREVADPGVAARARTAKGATAPSSLRELAAECHQTVASHREWLSEQQTAIVDRQTQLLERARRVASGEDG